MPPLYVPVAVLSGLLALALAWPGYRNREKPGAKGFLILVLCATLYAFATALGAAVTEPWGLFALQNLTVLAAGGLGVGWLLLTAEHTERLTVTHRVLGLFAAFLLGVQLVAWTNPLHHLFYVPVPAFSSTFPENIRFLFWGHAAIAYGLVAVGTALVFVEASRSGGVRRKQSLILLVAAVPAPATSMISNAGVTPVDVTFLGFPVATVIMAWALFRADFLDVVPVARATVVESMDDPVVTLDRDDRVVDCNDAAQALVGRTDDWEGTSVEAFFEPLPQLVEAITDGAVSDDTLSVEGDGGERIFDVTVSPIPDGATSTPDRGRVVVVRDVTQTARQRRRIERQNERLERLADVISHDMRAPVSTGRKTTRLLRRELSDPDPVVDRSLDNLEAVTDRLETFVEQLPQLARESTNVESTSECDLETLATRAWEVLDTESVQLETADTRSISGDPSRLQQVFENLFRNAVEHGSTSPPSTSSREDAVEHGSTSHRSHVRGDAGRPPSSECSVDGAPEDAVEHGTVVRSSCEMAETTVVRVGTTTEGFYVEDDGPGLPDSVCEDLFEYGTSTEGGSGFGLAIVRTIVEAHGWEIEALDSDAGGARFEIRTG